MKQRGSALIIAMMFIGLIGAIAFGIAKLIFADSSIGTLSENGAIAYYAAESGVEEGFLRYRYNQNAEVPFSNWAFRDSKVFRSNLVSKSVLSGEAYVGIPTSGSLTLSQQTYDLRMGYLGTNNEVGGGPFFYQDVDKDGVSESTDIFDASYGTGDYIFLKVPKDESRKFDLTNVDLRNHLAIGIKFLGVNASAGGVPPVVNPSIECKAMAEIKFSTTIGTVNKEYKALTVYNAASCGAVLGLPPERLTSAHSDFQVTGGWTGGAASPYRLAGSQNYYYSMDPSTFVSDLFAKAGDSVLAPGSYDNVTMTIKPLNYAADVAFITDTCNDYINHPEKNCLSSRANIVTGPYTYMTSTGYFGGSTRTLTANIDRQSGTLYDLYDYVLYKENN